jgi:hypothetical protein
MVNLMKCRRVVISNKHEGRGVPLRNVRYLRAVMLTHLPPVDDPGMKIDKDKTFQN